ncbi:MAG: T9SS type A sorting domain-containing protein [Bacteroidia bacterium]|jgi:hypothetical protein|nr:T9SS type A sorting domain-containing protein [Bacteroidia bacterium]
MKKIFTLMLMASTFLGFAQTNITFKVDMKNYGKSTANGVFVNGNFTTNGNEWCGSCNPMTDANSDGIWEVTIAVAKDSIDYKFTVDGWNDQERFASGLSCTRTEGNNVNRYLTRSGDVILDTVCFNACVSCDDLPPQDPSMGAAAPMYEDTSVISMFSDVYTDVNVNTWRTGWSAANFSATSIAGDSVHLYDQLDFVGIETLDANALDITGMDHINLDIWTPNATTFRVKLVNFGPGGNSEDEIVFNNPTKSAWVNYHIALDSFIGLNGRTKISQLIFSAIPAGSAKVYVDNVFFSKGEIAAAAPMTAAADPTADQADVISLFSGVYTDVSVNNWRTEWSAATLEDVKVDGNDVKKYTMLDFVGIEATGDNSIDASNMEHITFDAWTPNATTYRIKVVDFGADNAFEGGDDTDHEIAFEMPATETWTNHKIALADFTTLASTANISQIIFSALPSGDVTLYIDNLYFSKPEGNSVKENVFSTFKVYPNPATKVINLDLSAKSGIINSFEIHSINGQTMVSQQVNNAVLSQRVDITNLTAGVYFIKVNAEKGVFTQRIIVQ